jgi:hypothetical protein
MHDIMLNGLYVNISANKLTTATQGISKNCATIALISTTRKQNKAYYYSACIDGASSVDSSSSNVHILDQCPYPLREHSPS